MIFFFSSLPPSLSESFVCDMLKCGGARIEKGRFRLSACEFTWETLQRSNRIEGSSENNSISLGNVLPRPVRLPQEGL